MTAYILRRLAISVVVTLGLAALTFAMLHIIAPSPGRAILGLKASPQAVAAFNKAHGYDRPVWDQFVSYLHQLLQGNLGYSYKLNQTVNSLLSENWARSAYLTGIALFLAVVIAIPLGIFQAVKRNSIADQAVTAVAFTAYAMPDNFLGLILIGLFAIQLHWFPAEASQSESIWRTSSDIHAMFLPIVTLASTSIASYSRYMRSSALDALAQDYIRLARAKGSAGALGSATTPVPQREPRNDHPHRVVHPYPARWGRRGGVPVQLPRGGPALRQRTGQPGLSDGHRSRVDRRRADRDRKSAR